MSFRSLLVGLCVCVGLSAFAYADDIISNIAVKGLRNVKEKTVLSSIKLKKGKAYSIELARESICSIVGIEDFENCTFTFDKDTGVLTFEVVEKPYIEAIVFRGNLEFSKGKLKSISTLKEKEFYDVLKLEESKKKITKLYNDRGYIDSTIEVHPTIDVDTNRMTITFLITENSKVTVGGVKIEGVVAYPEKKILKLMKKIRAKKIFKEDTYQNDLARIEAFYKNNGFMDYKLITSSSSYNKARTEVFLTLNISEGIRYRIGDVSFGGNIAFNDKELEKTMSFKKGAFFNEQKILETKEEIVGVYFDKGYLQVQIVPEFRKNGDVVSVDWSIKENSVFYVGDIYIGGLERTKDKVIRRELLLKPEEVFSRKKLLGSVQRIKNLGFIHDVNFSISPTASNIADLLFDVNEEDSFVTIHGAIGYSSLKRMFLGGSIMHKNLFGLGQTLDISLETHGIEKQIDLRISWTNPYLFDRNMSFTLDLFNKTTKIDYSSVTNAYVKNERGFSFDVGPRISPYVSLLFVYAFNYVKLSNFSSNKINGKSVKDVIEETTNLDKNRATSLIAKIVYDSLDYRIYPSKGNKQLLSVNLTSSYLGGEIDYIRTVLRGSWFFPVFWKFVFNPKLEVGLILPYGKTKSVPVYEMFYIGGSESIRGYEQTTEIGPEGGGNFETLLNLECKFPIIAQKHHVILAGVFFFDIGGDCGDGALEWLGTGKNNLRSSAGVELRIAVPLFYFPIRVGWAYGFNRKDGKQKYDFYFSMSLND